ncbi:MAG: diphthamide synthesis protein [Nanoarchaeota archaeon]
MPRLFLIDAKWEGEIKLTDQLKNYLKKENPKSIDLFASVQFSDLSNFIKELEKLKIKINLSKAKRTDKPLQILGCDCYPDSFQKELNSDLILYIGDGMFHPKALVFATNKPITIFDPINNQVKILTKKDIEKELIVKKRNIRKYLNAEKIGILVTVKPGQQYLNSAEKLKEQLKKEGKKSYIFINDNINLFNLENYPFIKAWINTACPRIGTDDIVNTDYTIINLREALNPIKYLEDLENKNE